MSLIHPPETSGSDSRWREMSLNFADITPQSHAIKSYEGVLGQV
jgi:hypothetical protein